MVEVERRRRVAQSRASSWVRLRVRSGRARESSGVAGELRGRRHLLVALAIRDVVATF